MENLAALAHAHALSAEKALASLDVNPGKGLDNAEVAHRKQRFGTNEIEQSQSRSAWLILVEQLRGVVIYILIAAAAISFLFQEWIDGIAISLVLVVNTLIGFVSELRAVRSMETLRKLDAVEATVLRSSSACRLVASELVPGDIVLLEAGDLVPADLRLFEQSNLQCDESALTGESVPVMKHARVIDQESLLAERVNMAYRGCAVSSGTARGVVIATGSHTEIGHIAKLTSSASPETSPLEKRLDTLGHRLVWLTLGLASIIGIGGVVTGQNWLEMARIAVTLSVAAVPEGLPVVATVALARGMWRMARKNALINQLSAVETLGAMTMILTDKTGTLTENRMTLRVLALPSGEIELDSPDGVVIENSGIKPDSELATAWHIASLCNETDSVGSDDARGDPMELALIDAARISGFSREMLLEQQPERKRIPFNRECMLMATVHDTQSGLRMYVKGAPESVLLRCTSVFDDQQGSLALDDHAKTRWQRLNTSLGSQGLRVLALATRDLAGVDADIDGLTLVGLAGLMDPAREGVPEAIHACRNAGIRVVMVTGDQSATASKIAEDVGMAHQKVNTFESSNDVAIAELDDTTYRKLMSADVVSRVTPERKLELVELYQKQGHIVGMFGDGVNDAPALKKADIGIAMGQRGTDVAQEAAAVILLDDEFASITSAVEQGRVIYGNIRRFVLYLLSCNLSEIMLIGTAVLMGLPLPLMPIHILFLNFVTDVFPAFALGFGDGNGQEMRRSPRDPSEPVVMRVHWIGIGVFGVLIAASVFIGYLTASRMLGMTETEAISVSFIALAFAQLWHVFNIRDIHTGLLNNAVVRNTLVWLAVLGCMVLVVLAVCVPGVSDFLQLVNPGVHGWILACVVAFVPLLLGQLALEILGLSILGTNDDYQQGENAS